MARKSTSPKYKESKYARDLVRIMQPGPGPYTRSMLATELGKRYKKKYWQELMNEVSSAILLDRLSKKNRFRVVRPRWYGLS